MNSIFYAFAIVFLVIVALALMTAISFAWILIITELIELVNKNLVAKAVKESEAKNEAR